MTLDLAALRGEVKAGQQALREAYALTNDALSLLHSRCRQVDDVLVRLWNGLDMPAVLALAAVGGYGRGELYPASDIDLLILLPHEPDAGLQESLERLVGHFWDIGLEIGHSVRTIQECVDEATGDITIQTSLVEARLLTGNQALFTTLRKRLRGNLDPLLFFERKRLEQQERHLRFNETPYSLEPNFKEAPGGLRDLQVIFWVARVAGFGTSWSDLEKNGFLTADELLHIEGCEDYLRHLRIRLHLMVGRREDRLLFDYQNTLAAEYGIESTPGKRASERLMQGYYRNAKTVALTNTILMQNIGAALAPESERLPQPIDANFQSVGGLLDVCDEEAFNHDPGLIFESFLVMQRHSDLHGMTARTLRALWRARELISPEFRVHAEHRAAFVRLIQGRRGVVHEFRRMNQLDILGAYLPAFGRIVGQMQHDLFHVYTVDQHILQVLRNLRRFTMTEFEHEYPLCSRIIAEFDRPWLLYVAALFHDIAKGRGGDHSELGTVDARIFCEKHDFPSEDTELVVWLVRQHLVMSQFAQKEDLSDPEVIAQFSRLVGDRRRLSALYLLTHADIRGTSPKVWNQWKGKLLSDLPETVHERLWNQLDTVYFLRHSAEEIAWHTRSLHYRIFNEKPVVRARLNHEGEGLQVMVYTRDQPDLFARIVGFFPRAGYSIVDAKIHTTTHGYALDSFFVLSVAPNNNDREMISYIEHELTDRLVQQAPLEAPPSGRLSRQVKHFPIKAEAEIRADERGSHYVLTLAAADRPGLLYTVAKTIAEHGSNLHTAKISTLGERVEDVFLISGGDLDQSKRRIQLETELMERLKIS